MSVGRHLSANLSRSTRAGEQVRVDRDRKSTRLNSSHLGISYAVFCLKKKIASVLPPVIVGGNVLCRDGLHDIVQIGLKRQISCAGPIIAIILIADGVLIINLSSLDVV